MKPCTLSLLIEDGLGVTRDSNCCERITGHFIPLSRLYLVVSESAVSPSAFSAHPNF